MKTVKHEIKLERSVKIILGVFVVGVLLNAFPIMEKRLFTDANAGTTFYGPIHRVALCDDNGWCGYKP